MKTAQRGAVPAAQSYMLDTSVISALAPGREAYLSAGFAYWLQTHDVQLFIPCIAIAELAQGIGKLRRAGGTARAERLDQWLEQLLAGFGDRIESLDPIAARLAGQMSDAAIAKGRHPGFADVAIAAMALHKGHMLLTHNLKHFEPLGVPCCDPFVQTPA